ncbi:MAG: hypothetical protein F4Y00_07925 [Bacteroidetes bacterium SB0662_bin_6]|nr:hypothetical protein [Bacteroidetes bacterium SB0662_bin_6]
MKSVSVGFIGLLALAPARAQQEVENTSPETEQDIAALYQELHSREEEQAQRRLEIISMRGEAARLTANTEELNAQAQNCKARRDAYEAGAQVSLCPNDEQPAEAREVATEDLLDTREMESMFTVIEMRLAALEQQFFEAGQLLAIDAQGQLGHSSQPADTSDATLLMAGPARAVVRLSSNNKTAIYRLPFEARPDGRNCITTVKSLHGIGSRIRICSAGAAL